MRLGVHLGPFYASTGTRRRRRKRSSGGGSEVVAFFQLIGYLIYGTAMLCWWILKYTALALIWLGHQANRSITALSERHQRSVDRDSSTTNEGPKPVEPQVTAPSGQPAEAQPWAPPSTPPWQQASPPPNPTSPPSNPSPVEVVDGETQWQWTARLDG